MESVLWNVGDSNHVKSLPRIFLLFKEYQTSTPSGHQLLKLLTQVINFMEVIVNVTSLHATLTPCPSVSYNSDKMADRMWVFEVR
jgi:hypothetical protein